MRLVKERQSPLKKMGGSDREGATNRSCGSQVNPVLESSFQFDCTSEPPLNQIYKRVLIQNALGSELGKSLRISTISGNADSIWSG